MDGLIYILVAGVVGLLIGMVVMHLLHKKTTSDTGVKAVQEKLDKYQLEVESHFSKTADLIDNLTDSYKEVFEHLSDSAESLLTDEQIQNQLINRKSREVTIKYLKSSDEAKQSPPDSV
ncbi:YhcB family protein [Marinicella litoralis]|uniref:Z-ring associated protein G n=1 Tax=Marinicella litoralis TaxID=644220 RepID=A0A4R6XSD7_9GAMM|nr:DUF1043 family protein [Marinicella litoralis]TDR22676.1 uncharacterized protein DUF1043 [Marinicella litoralis]